ncbi:MAG: DUF3098 domain-containing protein [Flavobacteriales bacterium]|nr:DUF3098 domain-containing protein [Flavobacteriales bacterium]
MVFTRQNYILTAIAFAVVIIGFLLMYADKDEVYGFRSMTLAPIVVLLGFIIGVYAIMYKPKSDSDNGAD